MNSYLYLIGGIYSIACGLGLLSDTLYFSQSKNSADENNFWDVIFRAVKELEGEERVKIILGCLAVVIGLRSLFAFLIS